jgi:hypothetical protein
LTNAHPEPRRAGPHIPEASHGSHGQFRHGQPSMPKHHRLDRQRDLSRRRACLDPQQLVPSVVWRGEMNSRRSLQAWRSPAVSNRLCRGQNEYWPINCTRALKRARVIGLIEHAALEVACRYRIEKRDARLPVAISRLENDTECRHRCRYELRGIGRRYRQSHGLRGMVLVNDTC